MRLGIDLGTTRTVVAAADRGNYPVVSFENEAGDMQEWYPYLIGGHDDGPAFGFEAEAHRGEPGWVFLRWLKRLLGEADPETRIRLGHREEKVVDLLCGYLEALHRDIRERSNLEIGAEEPLDVWISVPANANNNQRFLTIDGFRRAGFRVMGVLNEPSAAGIEYVHRFGPKSGVLKKDHIAVYDLGGGTFDVSVIAYQEDRRFEVVTTEGIGELGGNDFDDVLCRLALEQSGHGGDPDDPALFPLVEECRERKEGLHPNTRKMVVDLGVALEDAGEVVVKVKDYYQRLSPLVDRTLEALEVGLGRLGVERAEQVGAIYLVGGGCELPMIAREVKKRHGRRAKRSPYPFSATAVGLAIAASRGDELEVNERFTRHFGVWREAEDGKRIVFDPIFEKDTPIPGPTEPPLVHTRHYAPAHNVGHFRYLECSRVTDDAQPAGDINPWDNILFPLDPDLERKRRLEAVSVEHRSVRPDQVIEERYTCDSRGVIEVTIENQSAGYRRSFQLRSHLSTD
jgi:molecular chaperone DnaK (HSP70)